MYIMRMDPLSETISLCVLHRDETIEPLDPPANSKVGDRVFVDGYQHEVAGGTVYWNISYRVGITL